MLKLVLCAFQIPQRADCLVSLPVCNARHNTPYRAIFKLTTYPFSYMAHRKEEAGPRLNQLKHYNVRNLEWSARYLGVAKRYGFRYFPENSAARYRFSWCIRTRR